MSVDTVRRLHFLFAATATGLSLGACSTMGDSTRGALFRGSAMQLADRRFTPARALADGLITSVGKQCL
jgi:hypothetical protein